MRSILIIEDNENLSRGISFLFEKDGFQTHVAPDLAAGRSILREQSFDLLILDLGLPDGDGIHFCAELREHSDIPIIILTARDMEIDEVSGLTAGADDYITKPFNPLELLARVKSMMRRYTSLGSIAEKNNVIRIGDVELDKDAKEVRVNGKLVKMTATEYGILQLLMENAGKVFSIDEIYERVWNESSFSPENTVSVHIRRIREKIEINPKEPRYLKVVWGIGYKIEKI